MPLASYGQRVGAWVIDFLIQLVITTVAGWYWLSQFVTWYSTWFTQLMNQAEAGGSPTVDLVQFTDEVTSLILPISLVSFLVTIVYQVAFLTWRGATPGKMAVGISVRLRETPGNPTFLEALKRQTIYVGTSLTQAHSRDRGLVRRSSRSSTCCGRYGTPSGRRCTTRSPRPTSSSSVLVADRSDPPGFFSLTLDRGLRLLDILARPENAAGMTVTALAAAIGMSRAAAYRLLGTLEAHGYVVRLPGGRVRLGYAVTRPGRRRRTARARRGDAGAAGVGLTRSAPSPS